MEFHFTDQSGNQVVFSTIADEHGWGPMDNSTGTTTAVARACNLRNISIRFIDIGDGTVNVIDLDADQAAAVLALLIERGFGLSSICTPIGKYPVVEGGINGEYKPLQERLDEARAVFRALKCFGRPFRVFPGYGKIDDENSRRDQQFIDASVEFCTALAQVAKEEGVQLLFETEGNFPHAVGAELAEFVGDLGDHVGIVYDAGNNVLTLGSTDAVVDDYRACRHLVMAHHLKDYRLQEGYTAPSGKGVIDEATLCRFVPTGYGHGGYPRILKMFADDLASIRRKGWVPTIDVEGHGTGGGHKRGSTTPDDARFYIDSGIEAVQAAEMVPDVITKQDHLDRMLAKLDRSGMRSEAGAGL